jgi:ABC-type branched-subunit amino acid transport system substrate-binding protein
MEEKRMKKLVSLLLVVGLLISMSACGNLADKKDPAKESLTTEIAKAAETKTAEDGTPYKIGVFLRFSDEAGTKMRAVVEKTIADINEAGGVKGHKLECVYYDTEGDSAKGIDAFTRLATQDNVLVAIGPTTSSVALAVIDLAAQYQIPLITPQATNTSITKDYGNEWFFRNSVADVYHSYTLADYIVKDRKLKKIAILHETGTLGLGQYENLAARLKSEHNIEPVIVQEWNEGDVDFKTQLLAVKAAQPDAIVFAGHEAELSIAVKQRLEVGISKDVPIFGFSSMSSSDFYGVAKEAAVGAMFTTTFSPTDKREDIQKFVADYKPVVNGGLDHNCAQAYDTVKLLAQVLGNIDIGNKADTLAADSTAIRDALANVKDYVGLTGVTSFGPGKGPEDRDGKKACTVYQLQPDYSWSPLKAAE